MIWIGFGLWGHWEFIVVQALPSLISPVMPHIQWLHWLWLAQIRKQILGIMSRLTEMNLLNSLLLKRVIITIIIMIIIIEWEYKAVQHFLNTDICSCDTFLRTVSWWIGYACCIFQTFRQTRDRNFRNVKSGPESSAISCLETSYSSWKTLHPVTLGLWVKLSKLFQTREDLYDKWRSRPRQAVWTGLSRRSAFFRKQWRPDGYLSKWLVLTWLTLDVTLWVCVCGFVWKWACVCVTWA